MQLDNLTLLYVYDCMQYNAIPFNSTTQVNRYYLSQLKTYFRK